MQYTIETRQLTTGSTRRPPLDVQSLQTVIEADDVNQAIGRFVRERNAELISFSNPARGRESIATIRKQDTLFLVRVYAGEHEPLPAVFV